MMLELLREVQVPFLGCALITGGIAKLLVRTTETRPALHQRRPVVVGTALVEGVLGVALFVTSRDIVRLAVIVVFATATLVVGELAMRRSEKGCGCFGGLSTAPAHHATLLRATALTVSALTTLGVRIDGVEVAREWYGWHGIALSAEFGLLTLLSPEIGVVVGRMRRTLPCDVREIPLTETYEALRSSGTWREYSPVITDSRPTEVWRELCLRYVVYPGEVEGQAVEVVFGVSLEGHPPTVTAALVTRPVTEDRTGDSTAGIDSQAWEPA